jgi:cytochrome b561
MQTAQAHPAPAKPHGVIAKILHWSTALLLLFAYIENGDVTNALRDPAAMRMESLLGIGIAAIFALRFFWMRYGNNGASRLPDTTPMTERRLATWAHYSLYGAVFAIVATGLLIPAAQAMGSPFLVDAAGGLHEFTTNTTLFLIAAHVLAALWHKVVRQDQIWESMGTPWWQPPARWFAKLRKQQ